MPYERKEKIYDLAQKYNFLILEDDPYYFLHFLDRQPCSFLSMDTDGRVIRFDSFSKILSAGLRLGVVTAHKDILEKMSLHIQCTSLHASSFSQVILLYFFRILFQSHVPFGPYNSIIFYNYISYSYKISFLVYKLSLGKLKI